MKIWNYLRYRIGFINYLKYFGLLIIIIGGIFLGYLAYKNKDIGDTIFFIGILCNFIFIVVMSFIGGETISQKVGTFFGTVFIYGIIVGVIFNFSEYFSLLFVILLSVIILLFLLWGLFETIKDKQYYKNKIQISCSWCGNPVYVNKNNIPEKIICSNCSRLRSQGRI